MVVSGGDLSADFDSKFVFCFAQLCKRKYKMEEELLITVGIFRNFTELYTSLRK